jgi:hypothetical protein
MLNFLLWLDAYILYIFTFGKSHAAGDGGRLNINENSQTSWLKIIFDWLAATLGIGTVMGFVDVGILSAALILKCAGTLANVGDSIVCMTFSTEFIR